MAHPSPQGSPSVLLGDAMQVWESPAQQPDILIHCDCAQSCHTALGHEAPIASAPTCSRKTSRTYSPTVTVFPDPSGLGLISCSTHIGAMVNAPCSKRGPCRARQACMRGAHRYP